MIKAIAKTLIICILNLELCQMVSSMDVSSMYPIIMQTAKVRRLTNLASLSLRKQARRSRENAPHYTCSLSWNDGATAD